MLTGVEILGIVLGVLPLVISAFEGGKGIWTTNKEFVSRRRPVQKLLSELRLHHFLFQHQLATFLQANELEHTGDVDGLVKLLLSDDYKDCIEERMGKQMYELFSIQVETCAEILKTITAKIEGWLPVSISLFSQLWKSVERC